MDNQRSNFFESMITDILGGTDNAPTTMEFHKKTIMTQNAAYDSIYSGKPIKMED